MLGPWLVPVEAVVREPTAGAKMKSMSPSSGENGFVRHQAKSHACNISVTSQEQPNSPGSIGGGSGTQLGGAIGGETGSWWSLEEGPDSCLPKPAARRERLIISLKRKLQKQE